MKRQPNATPEYANFENAMRAILRAPKEEVDRELEREKAERAAHGHKRGPKPKTSVSDRVSADKG